MKRNMYKIAKEIEINSNYDMTFSEWYELTNQATKGISDSANSIYTAFRYGYALGQRAEKKKV